MKQAALFVNEMQRLEEMKRLVTELQSRVDGWQGPSLAENNSLLLMEETFIKISHERAQQRTFFLFDRALLYCKKGLLKVRE